MNKIAPIVVVAALVAGGAYKTVLAKPPASKPKPKIEGQVYLLEKDFLINLADGRFAKLSVGFVMDPHDTSTAPAEGGHGAATPPEGFGTMPQEGLVREVVTDVLTDAADQDLIAKERRARVKARILTALGARTDVRAEDVLFTDITVQ